MVNKEEEGSCAKKDTIPFWEGLDFFSTKLLHSFTHPSNNTTTTTTTTTITITITTNSHPTSFCHG